MEESLELLNRGHHGRGLSTELLAELRRGRDTVGAGSLIADELAGGYGSAKSGFLLVEQLTAFGGSGDTVFPLGLVACGGKRRTWALSGELPLVENLAPLRGGNDATVSNGLTIGSVSESEGHSNGRSEQEVIEILHGFDLFWVRFCQRNSAVVLSLLTPQAAKSLMVFELAPHLSAGPAPNTEYSTTQNTLA